VERKELEARVGEVEAGSVAERGCVKVGVERYGVTLYRSAGS